MTDAQQIEALTIALQFAQQQRNEQAERCINFATDLELAKREIAALKAEKAE